MVIENNNNNKKEQKAVARMAVTLTINLKVVKLVLKDSC